MSLAIEEAPVVETSAPAIPRAVARPSRWHIWMLIAITLLGGVLRFWKLDQPAIWGDESATFMRVCGSYQELIDILQFNGFTPLHYELYQWIERGMPMWARIEHGRVVPVQSHRYPYQADPKANAELPAAKVNGDTKRVLVGEHPLIRGGSNGGGVRMTPTVMRLVPTIAGIAMVPVMYFLVVQMARKEIAMIAALFTATSAYLLIYSRDAKMYMGLWLFCTLSVACFLWWLRRRSRLSWLCWVAASCAMCGIHAPGAIVLAIELIIFLSWDRQWWVAGCIMLAGFVGGALLRGQTNLFGVMVDARWIAMAFGGVLGLFAYIAQRRRDWAPAIFFVLGVAVILSGIGGYYLKFNRFKQQIDDGDWRADSNLGWIDDYNRGRDGVDLVRYAGSAFLSGWEWATPRLEPDIDPRAIKLLHGSIETIAVLLLIGLIPWRTRPSAIDRAPNSGRRLFWVAAWILVPTYAFYCVSANMTSAGFARDFGHRFDRIRSELGASPAAWQPAFVSPTQWLIDGWQWLVAEGFTAWLILAVVVAIGVMLSARTTRQRLMNIASVIGCAIVLYALLLGEFFLLRELNRRAVLDDQAWHSLWIPRYFGFVWPAMAAAVATLLWRLPTKPLRYGAIGLLVALNFCQFCADLHTAEPPTDLLARDILNSQPASTSRTYLAPNLSQGVGAAPGEGLAYSQSWRYYLAIGSNMDVKPYDFRFGRERFFFDFHIVSVIAPLYIQIDTKKNPKVDRIITWEKIVPHYPDPDRDDPLPAQLGPNWKRTGEQMFTGYDHWRWIKMYDVRRREYVRITK